MSTPMDLRQTRSRDALDQIVGTADTLGNVLMQDINSELTMPLRMTPAGGSRVTNIGAITVVNPGHARNRTITPFISGLPAFTSGTITLPAATGGNIVASTGATAVLTIGVSQFVRVGIFLDASGNLQIQTGTAAGTLAGAGWPVVNASQWAIGYIVARTDGSGVVQNVAHTDIYQYDMGGAPAALTNPMSAIGQMIYGDTGGAATALAAGTANQLLQSNGAAAPTWVSSIKGLTSVLVNITTARANFNNTTDTPMVQLEGTTTATRYMSMVYNSNDTAAPALLLGKTRGTTVGATTVVQSGDGLGFISFQGSDGTEFVPGASISAAVDGTPGANDMPGRLTFNTTADGASSVTERMRIDSAGKVLIGTTTARTNFNDGSGAALVQIEDNALARPLSLVYNGNNTTGNILTIAKSRGATSGALTAVQNGDSIGFISFEGLDGTNPVQAAFISAAVDGVVGTDDMPGRLVFATTADGAAVSTQRMRIDSIGNIAIGSHAPSTLLHLRKNQSSYNNTVFIENTDNTDINSRASVQTTGGTVVGIFTSIATDGLFVGTSSAHTLYLGTGGSTRATVSSAGLWTIGVNSAAVAHVIRAGQTNPLNVSNTANDTNAYMSFSTSVTGVRGFIGAGDAGAFIVLNAAGSTALMTVANTTGAAVVGVTSSTAAHVFYGSGFQLSRPGANTNTLYVAENNNAGSVKRWHWGLRGDTANNSFSIVDETAGAFRMIIDGSTGNVAMGNATAPSSTNRFIFQTNTNATQIHSFVNTNTGTSNINAFRITAGTVEGDIQVHVNSGGIGKVFVGSSTANQVDFMMGGASKILLPTAGDVHINTGSDLKIVDGTIDQRTSIDNGAIFISTPAADGNSVILIGRGGTNNGSEVYISFRDGSGTGSVGTQRSALRTNAGNTAMEFTAISDARLKQNVLTITDGLERIAAVRAVTFEWVAAPGKRGASYIAQELKDIFPDCVSIDGPEETNFYYIGTSDMLPYMVAAIGDLKTLHDGHEVRIASIEEQLADAQARIADLEATIN